MPALQETQTKAQADAAQCGHYPYPPDGAGQAGSNRGLRSVWCWSQEPLPRARGFSRMYGKSKKLFKDSIVSLFMLAQHPLQCSIESSCSAVQERPQLLMLSASL